MRADARAEGQRWLDQATEDLRWTEHLAREGTYHLACFLAQQVTEKAIKAFLYAQGEEVVLGHSVERLCAAASRYNPEFQVKARTWSLLDGYCVPTRYPNGLPAGIPANVFTRAAAEGAASMPREAVKWVGKLLA